MVQSQIYNVTKMSFNAICGYNILTKSFGFIVTVINKHTYVVTDNNDW